MTNRGPDWFAQAERDLEQAQDSQRAGRHEWACFAAQQAAENAVTALHLHLGQQSEEALRHAGAILEFVRLQRA